MYLSCTRSEKQRWRKGKSGCFLRRNSTSKKETPGGQFPASELFALLIFVFSPDEVSDLLDFSLLPDYLYENTIEYGTEEISKDITASSP